MGEQNREEASFLPYMDVADGLARLRQNKRIYTMLLNSFVSDTSIMSKLEGAYAQGDAKEMQFQAHTLKGVAANLSLVALTEVIVPFEAKLKLGEIDTDAMPLVVDCYQQTIQMVQMYLREE